MRLGLFGGTFNPIHQGHLRSAEEILESLTLDRLWFIPAAQPPHKDSGAVTPFATRLTMTRLAVAEHPTFEVSDIEGQRPGRSYSIETIRQVRQSFGAGAEIFFILGLDAILEINTWKDYRQLFTLCHFVVLDRPGSERRQLASVLQQEVHPQFRYQKEQDAFLHPSGYQVFFRYTTLLDISSTQIRRLAGQGKSIRYLLPEAVRRYILLNKLYQKGDTENSEGKKINRCQ
ncbi:MAG: nicotinate-nucleotide adenylyltransferase [Desulfobacteraceae bacterium]